jgi:transcriptional regulator with XRE-family HTH domain
MPTTAHAPKSNHGPVVQQTQEEFAKRIGVSQSYLSAIEHGRNEVGAEVLLAIGREFGKSIDWLLTGKE